jgi:hypothetical protein
MTRPARSLVGAPAQEAPAASVVGDEHPATAMGLAQSQAIPSVRQQRADGAGGEFGERDLRRPRARGQTVCSAGPSSLQRSREVDGPGQEGGQCVTVHSASIGCHRVESQGSPIR